MGWINGIHIGDCRDLMRRMIADGVTVDCIVTSPPYWALRSYLPDGCDTKPLEIGLEPSLNQYVQVITEVFELCRQLLAKDGTLWLNMGDAYVGGRSGSDAGSTLMGARRNQNEARRAKQALTASRRRDRTAVPRSDVKVKGLKLKDMMGQPWRIAFALQAAGWYLRQDIIWHKKNPMPGSYKDRPTTSHEYIFLLSKSSRYHYDADAIAEPVSPDTHARAARGRSDTHKYADGGPDRQTIAMIPPSPGHVRYDRYGTHQPGVNAKIKKVSGWQTGPGSHSAQDFARAKDDVGGTKFGRGAGWRTKQNASFSAAISDHEVNVRNIRSVWSMSTEPFQGEHFAAFPLELARRCILAGTRPNGIVFDPFMGTGTTAQASVDLGRQFIGCDLNPNSPLLFRRYRQTTMGLAL